MSSPPTEFPKFDRPSAAPTTSHLSRDRNSWRHAGRSGADAPGGGTQVPPLLDGEPRARTTTVSVPSPFGAAILKAAAYQTDSRDRERHLQDAALLLAEPPAGVATSMVVRSATELIQSALERVDARSAFTTIERLGQIERGQDIAGADEVADHVEIHGGRAESHPPGSSRIRPCRATTAFKAVVAR